MNLKIDKIFDINKRKLIQMELSLTDDNLDHDTYFLTEQTISRLPNQNDKNTRYL